jgi:hypothetical protein
MSTVWNKPGKMKLGPGVFIKPEVGDTIPNEVLQFIGEEVVKQMVKDGQLRDNSAEVQARKDRIEEMKAAVQKVAGEKGGKK